MADGRDGSPVEAVVPGVWRVRCGFVNVHLVEDEGRVAVFDAGLRGDERRLETALRAIGRSPRDVTDVVLTHSHVDHMGFAAWAEARLGATVHLHPRSRSMAVAPSSRQMSEEGPRRYLRHRAFWSTVLTLVRRGGFTAQAVRAPRELTPGSALDVPGRPVALHTPGHCEGHTAFVLEDRGVVLTGDALVTYDTYTGATGPGILSRGVNLDSAGALRSLDLLAELPDRLVVAPGHGAPWTGGLHDAIECARAAGLH